MGMDESSMLNQSLPERWVAKIFQELQGNYGSRFLNQWKTGQMMPDGTDAGIKNAMATWARKLGGFSDIGEVFKTVLESLPEEPPSLPQFIAMCREAGRRLDKSKPAIEYKPTAEEQEAAAEVIRKASDSIKKAPAHDFKAWAKVLKARHDGGEVLSLVQVQAYQEALSQIGEPA